MQKATEKLDKQANGGGGNSPPELEAIKGAILSAWKRQTTDILFIGEKLAQVRDELKGRWRGWINANMPFSDQSARNYVRTWERAKKLKTVNPEAFKTVLNSSVNETYEKLGIKPETSSREGRKKPLPPASADLKPLNCPHCGKEIVSAKKGGAK